MEIFLQTDPSRSFQPFCFQHWVVLIFTAVLTVVAIFIGRRSDGAAGKKIFTGLFTALLVGNELLWNLFEIWSGRWSIETGLPLQLCDLGIYLTAYALLTRNRTAFEYAYFWGLAGTLHGLITPNLRESFPHYQFIKFFMAHVGILVGAIYLTVGCGLKPSRGSVKRVFLITNVYAAGVGVFNWAFHTNYLFLCHKPFSPSIIDVLGPWPFYLIGLEAIALLSLWLYDAPFFLLERMRSKT